MSMSDTVYIWESPLVDGLKIQQFAAIDDCISQFPCSVMDKFLHLYSSTSFCNCKTHHWLSPTLLFLGTLISLSKQRAFAFLKDTVWNVYFLLKLLPWLICCMILCWTTMSGVFCLLTSCILLLLPLLLPDCISNHKLIVHHELEGILKFDFSVIV